MSKLNSKFAMSVLFLLTYFGLTACGTKGPLYIPEQRYPQKNDTQKTPVQNNPAATVPTKEY